MQKILNASPGFGEPLSEQGIKEFLSSKVLNVHVGTVDEYGHANIHPAWYYYDSSKDKISIQTGKQSKQTGNLKRNNGLSFCSDEPNPTSAGLR